MQQTNPVESFTTEGWGVWQRWLGGGGQHWYGGGGGERVAVFAGGCGMEVVVVVVWEFGGKTSLEEADCGCLLNEEDKRVPQAAIFDKMKGCLTP